MTYIDEQGRCLPLPNLDDGGPVLNEAEMLWFARDGAHYFVTALDGSLSLRFVPASVSDDDPEGADCPLFVLAAIEDSNGNCQRWLYHPATGLPQFVVDGERPGVPPAIRQRRLRRRTDDAADRSVAA